MLLLITARNNGHVKTVYLDSLVQTIGIAIYKRLICEMCLGISPPKGKTMDISKTVKEILKGSED